MMEEEKKNGVHTHARTHTFAHLASKRGNCPAVLSAQSGRWDGTWAGYPGWRWSFPRHNERPLLACRPTDETAHLGNHASVLKRYFWRGARREYSLLFPLARGYLPFFFYFDLTPRGGRNNALAEKIMESKSLLASRASTPIKYWPILSTNATTLLLFLCERREDFFFF